MIKKILFLVPLTPELSGVSPCCNGSVYTNHPFVLLNHCLLFQSSVNTRELNTLLFIFFFNLACVGANHTAFMLPHFWVSDANWDAPCPRLCPGLLPSGGVAWSLASGVDQYQKTKPACLRLCSAGLMFHYERHLSFTSHIPATSWKSPGKKSL